MKSSVVSSTSYSSSESRNLSLLLRDLDDSSNEEEIITNAEQYDVNQAWEEFRSVSNSDDEDWAKRYSFTTTALGIGLLYSPLVDQEYRKRKVVLRENSALPDHEIIKHWVAENIHQMIKKSLTMVGCGKKANRLLEKFNKTKAKIRMPVMPLCFFKKA